MRKSTLSITILAAVLACGTAHAEGFTFKATQTASKTIGGVGPTGMEGMGSHVKGKSDVTREDGTQSTADYECVSMANPSDSKVFDAHMACDVSDKDGTFALVLGCNVISEDGSQSSCVGGMRGKTGVYKGRYGNFSQYSTGDAGKAKGSGQWFD